MPLLRFDILEGRSEQDLKKLLDPTHDVMVAAFEVPPRDRYQVVNVHKEGRLILQDTGVCTENLIRVDEVTESPKLAE
jgi:hypothetical protein